MAMSTIDEAESRRLAAEVEARGAQALEGIAISSGDSFVHESESQVILNGSYDINFTMDLVVKETGLFDDLGRRLGVPCEVSPLVRRIFEDWLARYGARAWSSAILRRIEDACGESLRAAGFPAELIDATPETPGEEVAVGRRERHESRAGRA